MEAKSDKTAQEGARERLDVPAQTSIGENFIYFLTIFYPNMATIC